MNHLKMNSVLNGLMTGMIYLGRRYIYNRGFHIYLFIDVCDFWHRLFSKDAVQQVLVF